MDVDAVVVAVVVMFGGGGTQKVSARFMGVQSFLLTVIPILIALKVSARDFVVGVVGPVDVVCVMAVLVVVDVHMLSANGL